MADIMQGSSFAEHGDRKEIEETAQAGGVSLEAAPPAPAGMAPTVAPAGAGGLDVADPVEMLQSGPTDEAPITDGLSVGPGDTPPPESMQPNIPRLTRLQKLAALATLAKSPHIRAQALVALRMSLAHRDEGDVEEA